jgi:Lrp/AsnC family transcriptional regulator
VKATGIDREKRACELSLLEQNVDTAPFELRFVDPAAHGRIALGIEIEQQNAAFGRSERCREIHRRGGLADAAFLIRYRNHALHDITVYTAPHESCSYDCGGEISVAQLSHGVRHTMQVELDRSDLRILDLIQEHGDLSAADVADRLGMTASTCWRRMSRLQELGVIRRRVALLDREKLGLNVTVFSHIKLMAHGRDALLRFEAAVREHPEILECYTMMGETDFLLRIVCRDIKAYEAFFLDHLSRFPGVQSVNSSIALAVIKETTTLPLGATQVSSSTSSSSR